MYCIVTVIYGVPVRRDALDEVERLGLEPEDRGIITKSSGGGSEIPAYSGIELSGFDECQIALPITSIRHTPTAAEVAKTTALIAKLPSSVRKKIKDPIGTYYIFSTS